MEELTACEGTVHSVIFQNAENGYTVLRLLTEEGEVVTVVGCIPCVAPGEHLTVSGVWENHPQHGEQLRAVELERMLPEDEEEIFDYLSSGICRGVGPATARRIVDRFGVETLDILEREPERLNLIKGITAKKAQEIAESFRQHMGLRRLMAFLAGTSCRRCWPCNCASSTGTRRWRWWRKIRICSPGTAAAWTSPSLTASPWAWASTRTATSGSRRR